MDPNFLYYGDNLDVLRRHVRAESVDLVYLDPPFNSNANYNVLFTEHGEKAAAQVQAFTDTWEWNSEARAAYEEVVEAGGKVADTMRAFRTMLLASDMLAYLSMMAPRLIELHRTLKPTGSLYLHCDPTASHYLKLLLDAVFGAVNFRSDITWKRTNVHNDSKGWSAVADTLLYYVKDNRSAYCWNPPYADHGADYVEGKYRHQDADGRAYRLSDLNAPGGRGPIYEFEGLTRPWRFTEENLRRLDAEGHIYKGSRVPQLKRYLDKMRGTLLTNVWTDINPINAMARERLGYPTQKPVALLRRIIDASTNPGDVVLDPFCGCGTTIDAAEEAPARRWIGIDITHLSIGLIKHRLADRYGPEVAQTYLTIGEPTTVDDARVLAKEDPFQFQAWALGLAGARVAGSDKKGGDRGIDGRLYFHDGSADTRQIVLSVKAGHLVPTFVRDLRGVIEREGAEIGGLLSFETPTAGMRSEAAEAGFYTSPWGRHPRIQLRTIGELLDGRGLDYPHVTGANVTHRRAPRADPAVAPRPGLFDLPSE
jgi:DNA modification methylase